MIHVIGDGGDRRHTLEDAHGAKVGWIRGNVIGFAALQSEERAVHAALAAWRALERAFGRHYVGWKPQPARFDRVHIVQDGAYEWVAAGDCPVARLYRPPGDARTGTFAIEIVLPSYASEAATISVAQILGDVVEPHRLASRVRDPLSLAPL